MKLFYLLLTVVYADQVAPTIKVTAQSAHRVPVSVHKDVLTAEMLRRNQFNTLDRALNSLPSMVVVQSGNLGQPSSLFMRGTNSNHMQVRFDGMRINAPDASNGMLDTGLVTSDSVSSISLLRGGQGSLYGSDAVGGVLLLTTPKATSTQESMMVEGGSHRLMRLSGNASHVNGQTGGYLGVSGTRNSGYHQTPVVYRRPSGHYPRLYYRHNGIVGRLDHQFNEQSSLMVVSRYSEADTLVQLVNRASPQERSIFLQRVQLTVNPVSRWSHQVGLGFFQSHQKNALGDPFETKTQGKRGQIDWTQTYQHQTLGNLSTGIEFSQDQAKQQDRSQAMVFHQDALGIGGLWTKKFQSIELDCSIRRDKIAGFDAAITHREGLVFTPLHDTKFKASYGTSFKTPTLYQLYAKTPYYKGNPFLKPEQSKQWDISVDHLLFKKIRWEETYFVNRLTQLIYPTHDFMSSLNLGKARIRGVESTLTWVNATYQFSLSHTLMHAENRVDRTRLLRRPQTKLSSNFSYKMEDWLMGVDLIRLGRRPDLDPVTFVRTTAKPYTLVNVRIQKTLESGMRLYGRLEDVLNRKIQEPLGYRKSGLAVYLGMEAKIA